MGRTALLLVLVAGSTAHAEPAVDELAVLRDPTQRWTYELVGGARFDALAPIPKAPSVTCSVTSTAATESRITCTATGSSPLLALVSGPRTLVFDDAGVRELHDAAPAARHETANAMALTFPKSLAQAGLVEATSKAGASVRIEHRLDTMLVRGSQHPVWLAEAWTTPAAKPRVKAPPIHSAAVFAPGIGPVVLCRKRDDATPAYICLRLVETPVAAAPPPTPPKPTPQVTLTRKVARSNTTLTADKLVAKVSGAYLAGIKRCYADVLASKPTAAGTLAYVFTVNAVGKTESIDVKSFNPTLTACASKLAAGWRFPIPVSEYAQPLAARFELAFKLSVTSAP